MRREKSEVRSQKSERVRRSLWGAFRTLLVALLLTPTCVVAQQEDAANGEVEFYESETVRDAAKDVLSGPEFRGLPRLDLGPDGKKAEPLKPKETESPRSVKTRRSSGGGLFTGLFGGAISLAVVVALLATFGAIFALIALGLRHWERADKAVAKPEIDVAADDELEQAVTPGERPADAWLAAAREAAAAGRFDEAVALLLLGAMGHAERAELIRPRRGLTYRDYLRAVPDSSAWHDTLDRLIRAYAPVGFGRRKATAATFDAVVGPYETALSLEPTRRSEIDG